MQWFRVINILMQLNSQVKAACDHTTGFYKSKYLSSTSILPGALILTAFMSPLQITTLLGGLAVSGWSNCLLDESLLEIVVDYYNTTCAHPCYFLYRTSSVYRIVLKTKYEYH